MILLSATTTVVASAVIFLLITLLLVIILLVARHYLVATGNVQIDINNGTRVLDAAARAAAGSARCRSPGAAAKSCPPRPCTSRGASSKTTGAWAAR